MRPRSDPAAQDEEGTISVYESIKRGLTEALAVVDGEAATTRPAVHDESGSMGKGFMEGLKPSRRGRHKLAVRRAQTSEGDD